MLVTDVKRTVYKGTKKEKELTGFYMDGFLKENLDDVPIFLKKAWDCVGIVSGHGKVRIGKSTLASQLAFYISWLLAGGIVKTNEENQVIEIIPPKEKVRFNLKENVVFSAEELQERASNLHDKYGKNQVILYDEGRQGLDSARAMESINKGMSDFFEECGFMGHVIIVVLPSFFKLHEDYAVARSLFLVDVFTDKQYNRGYFNFYNEKQKELLYFFGKKKLGVTAKYQSANESFWGKFTIWLPFNKKEYEQMKKDAIDRKRLVRRERNLQLQKDILIFMLNKHYSIPYKEIKSRMKEVGDFDIGERTIGQSIERINEIHLRQKGYY